MCRAALNQRRLSFPLVKKATSDICVKEACSLCANVLLERSAPQKGKEILLTLFPRGFFCSLPKLLQCFDECAVKSKYCKTAGPVPNYSFDVFQIPRVNPILKYLQQGSPSQPQT